MGAHEFFENGDKVLDNGGQVMADTVGMIPGAGEVVDGLQAAYHGQHAWSDVLDGNWGGAAKEEVEAGWHAIKALPGAHELLEAPDYVESGYDVLKTVMGGDTPLVPGAAQAWDQKMGTEHDPWTGEQTNVPLVSPEMRALAFGHFAK